ncbi:MAG: AraC family transcriptional regulator [Alphaproteobacteria bacterium]|nr:AraC family transcriptional regulator [Alphaproteobacteria bacterium]
MKYRNWANEKSLPGVEGYSGEYARGHLVEHHIHEAAQIVHAAEGVMRVAAGGSYWVIPPGRGLWVPAGVTHGFVCVTSVSVRTVYLSGGPEDLPAKSEVWQISNLMREVIIRLADGTSPSETPHLAALLLHEIERREVLPLHIEQPSDRRAVRVAEAVIKDPADNRSLEAWAHHAGASPRTLKRLFRSETGLTFGQWRRHVRLITALELLALGEPVTQVGLAVGYESTSAFIEMFREQLGTTPGKYFAQ